MATKRDFVVKNGLVVTDSITLGAKVLKTASNAIAFGNDTQEFQLASANRMDISDEGVRLGGANSRVTTILNEDNMATNSDTALATQQSIKAYVDNNGGASAIDNLSDAITTATSNIGLGSGALDSITASNGNYNVALGINAGTAITTGDRNISIGYGAADGYDAESDNIAIGYDALGGAVDGGEKNLAIGNYAGDAVTTGDENVLLGHNAGSAQTTGLKMVAIGADALKVGTAQNFMTAVGHSAGHSHTGTEGVLIGSDAGYSSSASHGAVHVGRQAGYNATGNDNVSIGRFAMFSATSSNTGANNVAMGRSALGGLSSGGKNIAIGYAAGDNITTGSNNVMIGGADAASATGSDQLSISSGDGSPVWITGDSSGAVNIPGSLTVAGSAVGGIASLAADSTPQLGGDLDVNGNDIVSSATNGDINITPAGTGSVKIHYPEVNNSYALMVASSENAGMPFSSSCKTTGTNAIVSSAQFMGGLTTGTRAAGFGTQIEFRLGEIPFAGHLAGKVGAKMADSGNANFDMFITPSGTGDVKIGNFNFDGDQTVGSGQDNYVLTYDNSAGTIGLEAAGGGGASTIGALDDVLMDATNFVDSLLIQTDSDGSAPTTGTLSSAENNIGIGKDVFKAITNATMNVGIGGIALESLTSGDYHTAVGYGALSKITTVTNNTAVGFFAGRGIQNGGNNTAIGADVLRTDNDATQNTGVGASALKSTTGNANTGLGYRALYANTSGTRNIAIGVQALDSATTETDNIAIGHEAMYNPNGGDKNVAIGNYAMDAALTGDNNVAIGYAAGGAMTDAHSCVLIGHSAGVALTTGVRNVAIGFEALKTNTTSGDNVAIGEDSLTLLSTGSTANVAIGRRSGYRITANATDNVFIGGYETGGNIASGDANVLIGSLAGQNLNGASHSNVLIGYGAGNGGSANAAHQNHAIGYDALGALSTGVKNIAIGYQSGNNITSGSNNVVIGNADVPSATADDQLSISSGDGGVTWITGNSSGGINSKAEVVAVSGNTTLTLAQTGSYIYWTAGTLTLPASGAVGTQYTVINNTGGSATVAVNASNCSLVAGFSGATNATTAIADHELASFVCVTANTWIQVG